MALAEFIAATQAEMKSKIEEECKKQMMTLLEDSFSSKWEEYTNKLIDSSSKELYTKNHGKLELTIDNILSSASDMYWYKSSTDADNRSFKQQVLDGIKLIQFDSPSIYIIHYILKLGYESNRKYPWEMILFDNYGYYHTINFNVWNMSYTPASTVIVKKDIKYTYPLTNAIIDAIKSNPTCIRPDTKVSTGTYNNYQHVQGDNMSAYLTMLPVLRVSAVSQWEHYTAINRLLEENIALKAKISRMEARVPTEDLLGLTGSNMSAAGGCAANETEPSRL